MTTDELKTLTDVELASLLSLVLSACTQRNLISASYIPLVQAAAKNARRNAADRLAGF